MKNMNEDTIRLIENRKSSRAFIEKEIDKATIDKLKELTMRAPSAGNMLLYSVLEITDKMKKAKLAKICDNQIMIEKAPLVWIFLADMNKWLTYFKEAKCDEKENLEIRKIGIGDLHLSLQDAIIAGQNCAISAEALGLTSCYIGDVIENFEELKTLLDLPPHVAPACMLIMGYPTKSLKDRPLTKRAPLDSNIFMENSYKMQNLEDLSYQYSVMENNLKEIGILSKEKCYADHYYKRKFSSSFMKEMNRSCQVILENWINF